MKNNAIILSRLDVFAARKNVFLDEKMLLSSKQDPYALRVYYKNPGKLGQTDDWKCQVTIEAVLKSTNQKEDSWATIFGGPGRGWSDSYEGIKSQIFSPSIPGFECRSWWNYSS